MDDLKDAKLAASSRFNGAYATLLGATPITVTNVETYAALDHGMVAGTFLSISGFLVFKLQEVAKHHLEVPFGASCAGFFMNKDIFARLPETARRAIETTSGEPQAEKLGSFADRQWVEDRAKRHAGTAVQSAGRGLIRALEGSNRTFRRGVGRLHAQRRQGAGRLSRRTRQYPLWNVRPHASRGVACGTPPASR